MNTATLAIIGALLSAIAEVAPLFILIFKNKMEKDKELKEAKDGMLKEWNAALASKDKSRILDMLIRVRQAGA